jgi:hypothetical protein
MGISAASPDQTHSIKLMAVGERHPPGSTIGPPNGADHSRRPDPADALGLVARRRTISVVTRPMRP